MRITAVAVAAFAAGSVLSGAGAVWASHQFPDVRADNPFHADIAWMVDHDIADGYDDGTFKPTNPVSRQAMSAFMRRLSNRTVLRYETIDPPSAAAWQISVECELDERAVGGGGEVNGASVLMTDSRPLGGPTEAAGWTVAFQTDGLALTNPVSMTGYATCVPR
jgi:hypothetical protein